MTWLRTNICAYIKHVHCAMSFCYAILMFLFLESFVNCRRLQLMAISRCITYATRELLSRFRFIHSPRMWYLDICVSLDMGGKRHLKYSEGVEIENCVPVFWNQLNIVFMIVKIYHSFFEIRIISFCVLAPQNHNFAVLRGLASQNNARKSKFFFWSEISTFYPCCHLMALVHSNNN